MPPLGGAEAPASPSLAPPMPLTPSKYVNNEYNAHANAHIMYSHHQSDNDAEPEQVWRGGVPPAQRQTIADYGAIAAAACAVN